MSLIVRSSIACAAAVVLSSGVTSLFLASATPPAHAGTAKHSDEVCSSKSDTRSSDGKVSAVWSVCIKAGGWSHGTLSMVCWGGTVLWTTKACFVEGDYDVSKDGQVIKNGYFSEASDGVGYLTGAQTFTYNCQGPGRYTFTIRNAKVYIDGKQVNLPEKSASSQGC
jgi:hypothetical protein